MIDQNLFIALVSFYFVMYVTPGPNNAMVLTSGIKFGYLKTIPHEWTISPQKLFPRPPLSTNDQSTSPSSSQRLP